MYESQRLHLKSALPVVLTAMFLICGITDHSYSSELEIEDKSMFDNHSFVTYGAGEIDLRNKWFFYCESKQIPYVHIAVDGNYSTIEFDVITFHEFSREWIRLSANEELVKTKAQKIFEKYRSDESTNLLSWGFIKMYKMPISSADLVARDLVSLISEISDHAPDS